MRHDTEDDAKYKLREPKDMDFWNIREKMAGEDVIRSWHLSSVLTEGWELSQGDVSAMPLSVFSE